MTDIPIVLGPQGMVPASPAAIQQALLAAVAATNPGYTANLPGSLIEDISSTDVGAIVECNQALVELINSITPYGANDFILGQLGQIYGVPVGADTNTSVNVVITGPSGSAGFVIAQGFTVSDGTNQYIIPDGGIIGSSLSTPPLFAIAVNPGSFAVPANSVTQIVTSVPASVGTLTVTNPQPGTPGAGMPTQEQYRASVLQAGLASAQGMSRFLKTILGNVANVQPRLISVLQQSGGGWEIIVGGGDPYQVANAIFTGLFDISTLVGSVLNVSGITNANPMVVTTVLNHGYATGQVTSLTGVSPGGFNYTSHAATVITEKTFSVAIDSTGFGAYVSGGVVTPNLRNTTVDINDYPNIYAITFVEPPQQNVAIALTWNTDSPNFVNPAAVAQLGSPALVNYVNNLAVGQPINLFELQAVFQIAIASIIDPQLLTRMVFSVSINGVGTSPTSGTGIIAGDPESYFLTSATSISIVQG